MPTPQEIMLAGELLKTQHQLEVMAGIVKQQGMMLAAIAKHLGLSAVPEDLAAFYSGDDEDEN